MNLQSQSLLVGRYLMGFSLLNSATQSDKPSIQVKSPSFSRMDLLASLYHSMRKAKGKAALTHLTYCNYFSWFEFHKSSTYSSISSGCVYWLTIF